jgi:beta-galactosidase/beta-glucuronidase
MSIPKPAYPRPQFVREDWLNLNGQWDVKLIHGASKSHYYKEFPHELPHLEFNQKITVPFCPESPLSGIGNKEFLDAVIYHREISIPQDWKGSDILLNFGAVYYKCAVFIDNKIVGRHTGGSVSFSIDLTDFVKPGKSYSLIVVAKSNLHEGVQPGGKQSSIYNSQGCMYTRVTGIWQTVWLEKVSPCGLSGMTLVSDLESESLILTPVYRSIKKGQILSVKVSLNGEEKASCSAKAVNGRPVIIGLEHPSLWSPESPDLYDILLTVTNEAGKEIDRVESYHGMREVSIEGNQFLLNGKPYYQRLVLDQGFNPEGIWTSPSDEQLKGDIELSKKAGFNGARLHQKVFEARFFYWADKLGYLCWGETASWGSDPNQEGLTHMNFLSELREELVRDRNHPSIVAWTPYNETRTVENREQHERIHLACTNLCKAVDPTRPVNDASGYVHYVTDLYTVHNYEQDPEKLKKILELDKQGRPFRNFPDLDSAYKGQPYLIDEFGGIKWDPETMDRSGSAENWEKKDRWNSWGYGKDVESEEEFYHRLEGQVNVILNLEHICGYCYTQLTDVEQETNGVYFYDRTEKFDMKRIKGIFSRVPKGYYRIDKRVI